MLIMHHAAAEVQPVEVNELRVGTIGDRRGYEQGNRLTPGGQGQELLEPGAEFSRGEHAPHQVGLDQTRRKEIGAAWLPGRGDA